MKVRKRMLRSGKKELWTGESNGGNMFGVPVLIEIDIILRKIILKGLDHKSK